MAPENRTRRFTVLNLILLATSVALVCATLVVPIIAQAQSGLSDYGIPQVAQNAGLPMGQTTPAAVIAVIVNSLLGVLGVVAVVVILYGGFLWMTAGGNEERVRTAKALLGGAVVGLTLVLASYAIASFVVHNVSISSGYVPGSVPSEDLVPAATCLPPASCVPLSNCTGQIVSGTCSGSYVCCRPTYTPPSPTGCSTFGQNCDQPNWCCPVDPNTFEYLVCSPTPGGSTCVNRD